TSGNIITDHLSLLNRPLVIAHGGFTVELWFKGLSTGIQKVFDYAGTENIRTTGLVEGDDDAGVVQLNISNGTVLPLGVEQGLQVTGWNHLVVTYEVQDELDPARLQGRLAATLNGVVSSLESAVLTA